MYIKVLFFGFHRGFYHFYLAAVGNFRTIFFFHYYFSVICISVREWGMSMGVAKEYGLEGEVWRRKNK